MIGARAAASWGIPLGVLAGLALAQFALPDYHHTNMARIMVLAAFAVAYNIAFGYTGLLSLGHAMFFAAGLYGAGLTAHLLHFAPPAAFLVGAVGGLALGFVIGLIALRTRGVSFLIVTLMFAQAVHLTTLYFNDFTRGDEGFVLAEASRQLRLGATVLAMSDPAVRYNSALLLFAVCYLYSIVLLRSPTGRVFIALRENESRTQMLGYDTFGYKLLALTISGALSGMAGAAYALLFAYVGSTFASTQYSIYPLLWVLLGGAGTPLGPLLGTALMFYLVDFSSGITSSYMIAVGIILVVLIIAFPKGIIGTIRQGWGGARP